MMRFDGQTAVVTGGASGLGAATAQLLAQQGAEVWIADRDEKTAAQTVSMIANAKYAPLEVTSEQSWNAVTAQVMSQSGKLDILVNCAGITGGGPQADIANAQLETWRKVFAVNVEGTLLGCQAALRVMKSGAIVNVASTAAISPSPALAAYGASKAAVLQLTHSVAAWCAMKSLPIRCNAVVPGMALTPMTAAFPNEYKVLWEQQIPMGRFSAPHEVAATIAFLASSEASYITGADIRVDGGLLSRPVVK